MIQQRGNGRAVHSLTSTQGLKMLKQNSVTIGITAWLSNYTGVILRMILVGFGRAVQYRDL